MLGQECLHAGSVEIQSARKVLKQSILATDYENSLQLNQSGQPQLYLFNKWEPQVNLL